MLPNSLTKVLPFALVYSTHLPVSVCGTGAQKLCLETFLGNKTQPLMPYGSLSPQLNWRIYLPVSTPRWIAPKSNNGLAYLVASSHRTNERFRNVDRMSITYASRPRLRTRLTRQRNDLASETLDIRRTRFSRVCTLLMPAFSLLSAPVALIDRPSLLTERSPTNLLARRRTSSIASVLHLAPLSFPRKVTRPVSCYALFKGWLLLSQPPGCSSNLTSFPT